MNDLDQRTRFVAMRRGSGMSNQRKLELGLELARKDDWVGSCRICGQILRGTPSELLAHPCGENQREQG